jgi:hypothetical protein
MGALQLSVAVQPVELAAPFRISGFVFERQDLVVVTLRDGALRGRGEASGVYYLKDDPQKIVATPTGHGLNRASTANRFRNCCRREARATPSIAPCGSWMRLAPDGPFGS